MNEPLRSEITQGLSTKAENPVEKTRDEPTHALTGQAETIAHEPGSAASAELPTIPGFEIRAVLGHGGMGVVYQAWQISLKRHVALKMILAGEHAGPQHLARFRTEAEAVAQLQHPNIVQIYAISEHQGRPYVCLEYVDGGSLARRLNHQPQPPLECARIVELLARAMHYTHQRGIVHRDLKPANILIQESGVRNQESEVKNQEPGVRNQGSGTPARSLPDSCLLTPDSCPKITDFGLAKQLQDDAGQTMSGAVMGTPSYMAPEQAAGKTHEIGPLSDVYALGVILHEMLTGRPPFHGDTQVETLRQVIHEEPIPPSKIQPGVPRDLETICLKAMAKERARRYSSALALAQDLERFVAGEPILARREGPVRRMWRKLRRRPATYASLLVLVLALIAGGLFAWEFSSARQVRGIIAAINQGLQEPHWTRAHLEYMEALIGQLEPLSPEQAASARRNLFQRYADALIEAARQEHNGPDDFARIEKDRVEILQPRARDLADTVSQAMTKHVLAAVNARLGSVELTAAYLNDVDRLIAAIESFDKPGADKAWIDLDRRIDGLFQQRLDPNNTLTVSDLARLEEEVVTLLEKRRPELARSLRGDLTKRQGVMQKLRSLQPPFADADELFKTNFIAKTPTHLLSKIDPRATEKLVLLGDACRGNVQMEATFAYPSWGTVKQLGLSLNTSANEQRGYSFLLTVPPASNEDREDKSDRKKTPETLEWARTSSTILMKIRRNGIVLRQLPLRAQTLAARPLTLRARRVGSVLTLEVSQEGVLVSSVSFDDMFAATGSSESGVFALLWPGGVGLEALHLRRQTLPPVKGPLELADHHLAEGDVKSALALYQKQAESSTNPEVRQEARCKQALCLLELKHVPEATQLLVPLAQEKGRWPLLATCQLWLIYLRDNNRVAADQVCDTLLTRGYGADQLAAVISDDVRSSIRYFGREEFSSYSFLLNAGEERMQSMERMHKINELFPGDEVARFYFRWNLLRAYRIVGKTGKAEAQLERWLQNDPPLSEATYAVQRIMFLEEFGWICREQGRPQKALGYIDRELRMVREKAPGDGSRLLIERARLHAALNNLKQAEKDLDEYFQAKSRPYDDYQSFSGACLLRGFLRRRAGDEAGAQQAWSMKYVPAGSDPQQALAVSDARAVIGGGIPAVQAMIMASLTNQITEAQAQNFQERLLKDLPANYRTAIDTLRFRMSAAVMRGMFRSENGRKAAERMAFQDVPLVDYLKFPVLAGTSSVMSREGFAAATELSAEQEQLIWELSEEVWKAMRTGKLEQFNLVQMGMTWKGITNFFGWAGLSAALEKEKQLALRGRLAYVMAHRLLRLGQPPEQAIPLFRTAVADAPADSSLRRLAEAELQRLKTK